MVKTDVNLGSKRIRELRESNLTVGDLRKQIGLSVKKELNTKKQINKILESN